MESLTQTSSPDHPGPAGTGAKTTQHSSTGLIDLVSLVYWSSSLGDLVDRGPLVY